MSQNSSTHQPVLDVPELDIPELDVSELDASHYEDAPSSNFEHARFQVNADSQDASVEAYANHLMDELFEEVDHVLDRGGKLPSEPLEPEYVSLQPIAVPEIALPPVLAQRPAAVDTVDSTELAEINAEAVEVAERRRGANTSFDGLLLAAACASLIATGVVWFALQNRLQQAADPSDAPVATQPDPATADQTFATYVQRSLDRIERDTVASRQSPGSTSSTPAANGAAPTPASNSTVAAAPPTVLERVYIPVYQPPQLFNQLPGGTAPAAPPVNAPAASVPAPAASPQNIAAAPNAAPSPSHVLIGVLELGDRSAALFEVNGTPQRVYIGEGIGSSGWTLVSIANQEAIVRRNGEVRSIYVGQLF
ncbi:hypothetical protein IQ268_04960 [Oculatella sp. LEGE 06141]|uniref:hypothetical protein n=1 Tax=Oculatella sp. LEGE 06141 TaxID=1828648 RepID=UPI001881375C|nr:hypothetical protein [Oculatella sp. LEGE 06141]MBE9177933.1 hypothetical protein [Oculatella sp. LEGE 06141]